MKKVLFFAIFALVLSGCTKTERIKAPETIEDYVGFFIKETKKGQTKWGAEIFESSDLSEEACKGRIPVEYDSIIVGIGKKYMAQKEGAWQLFNNIDGELMLKGLSFYSAEPQWNSFEVVNMDINAAGGTQPFVEGTHFRLKTLDGYYAAFIRNDLTSWCFCGPYEDYYPAITGFFIIREGKVGFADFGVSRYIELSEGGRSFEAKYDALIEVVGQERNTPRKGFLALKDGKWISLSEYGNPGKWSDSYIKKLLDVPATNPDQFDDMVIYLGNRYNIYYTKLMYPNGKCGRIYINALAGERGKEPKMR